MGLSLKKMFRVPKKLRKWQPGKTIEKVAQFVPGGSALVDTVKGGLDLFKKRQSDIAAGQAYATTAPTSFNVMQGNTPMLLIGAGLILVLFLVLRKR